MQDIQGRVVSQTYPDGSTFVNTYEPALKRDTTSCEQHHHLWIQPRKIALAARLWEQTTASLSWIAAQLQMKSAANVSQILRRHKATLVKIC